MPQQIIVVFDTSVLVTLILPASRSAGLFERLRTGGHRVALTEPIYEELEDKLFTNQRLRPWMRRSDDEIKLFLADRAKLQAQVSHQISRLFLYPPLARARLA